MGVTTKIITLSSFIALLIGCISIYPNHLNKNLNVICNLKKDSISFNYYNLSTDTVYVADFSLTRSKILPEPSSDGVLDLFFYIKTSSIEDGYNGVKIFLGAVAIPPQKKYFSSYKISNCFYRKAIIEYSYQNPKSLNYTIKKIIVNI